MIPSNEIVQAATQPFTQTNTWYGLFVALAFRKQIRRLVEWFSTKLREKGSSAFGGSE